jgi:hypothetical protein
LGVLQGHTDYLHCISRLGRSGLVSNCGGGGSGGGGSGGGSAGIGVWPDSQSDRMSGH